MSTNDTPICEVCLTAEAVEDTGLFESEFSSPELLAFRFCEDCIEEGLRRDRDDDWPVILG